MIRMIKLMLFGLSFLGCAIPLEDSRQRTVEGILQYYPSNVKSVQAWHGHNYLVGNTPVVPTTAVPEDMLRRFVGSQVVIVGLWYPGKQSQSTATDGFAAKPVEATEDKVIRGDGLKALSIKAQP